VKYTDFHGMTSDESATSPSTTVSEGGVEPPQCTSLRYHIEVHSLQLSHTLEMLHKTNVRGWRMYFNMASVPKQRTYCLFDLGRRSAGLDEDTRTRPLVRVFFAHLRITE
jgi:hypothetical protein